MCVPKKLLAFLLSVTMVAELVPVGQATAFAGEEITELGDVPSESIVYDDGLEVTGSDSVANEGSASSEAPVNVITETTDPNSSLIVELPAEESSDGVEVIDKDESIVPETKPEPTEENEESSPDATTQEAEPLDDLKMTAQAAGDVNVNIPCYANHDQGYALLGLVNQARSRVGRGGLVWDADLENYALQRAYELVIHYDHTRPNGASATSGMPGWVTGSAAENIAMMGWEGNASELNELWTNSPGHYSNMIHDGVACFGAAIVYSRGMTFAVEVFRGGGSNKQYRVNYGSRVWHMGTVTTSPAYFSMTVSPTSMSLTPGQSGTAQLYVGYAEQNENAISWSSSNTSVATVSADTSALTVTGKSPGTATITGTLGANGKQVFINVTVRTIDPTSIALDRSSLSLYPGGSSSLTATVYPTNSTDKTVTWSSSDTSIATVSSSGVVTAKNAGTATITARTWNGKAATCYVTVNRIDISGAKMGELYDMAYTGTAKKPEPGVTLNGTKLTKDKDFTYSYKNNTEVGTATVTATGIGNYTGSVSSTFVIYPTKDVPVSVVWNDVNDYFGTRPTHVSLPYESSGKDTATTSFMSMGFVVTYASDGWKSSTGRLRATSYDGTAVAFDISPANVEGYTCEKSGSFDTGYTFTYTSTRLVDIAGATVSGVANKTYTGKAQTQSPTVKINGITLKEGTDYTITYQNNTNAGTATVTIAGKGMFTGTKPVNFTIAKAQISQASGSIGGVVYTGKAIAPKPTLTFNGATLKEGTDYTLSYQNNTNAGTATAIATGKGNFTGSNEMSFNIGQRQISSATVTAIADRTYTGAAQNPQVTANYNGVTLKAGTDYTVAYKDNVDVGTATVTLTGKGNFTGTKQVTFSIIKAKISTATVAPIAAQTYTGSAIKPSVTATFSGRVLKEGTDYTLSYANSTQAGTARVTLTGKGSFEGTQSVEFTIAKAQMDRVSSYIVGDRYTGKPITPKPDLTYNGITLKEGTDYTLSYQNNTNAGTATCIATGMGNFTGSLALDFDIIRKQISSATLTAVANRTYTGAEHKPQVTATYNGITLKAGTDYTVSYENNVGVGTAKVILTGEGNFTGMTWIPFTIARAKISAATVAPIAAQTYTGSAIKPSVTATFNGKTLEEGKDYTLAYTSNTKAGTATVTLTGWGNFEDTKTVEFSIAQAPISSASFAAIESQNYTGKALTPGVTATFNGVNLRLGTDYTLSYANNTDVGTATVTVSGKGNFTGTKQTTFAIAKANISAATVASIAAQTYTGSAIKPPVKVTFNGEALEKGTDYTVSYENNVNAGAAKATITGKGNFTGTKTLQFEIAKASVSKCTVSAIGNQAYNGKLVTPKPTVKLGSLKLTLGTHYTLSYKNNTKAGTATVTIKGKGNLTGSRSVTFRIVAPSVSYYVHRQTYGWESAWSKKDGDPSGTTGESKRLEGIKIKLGSKPYSGGISYRTHIQTYGWESSWKSDGTMSGTTGESKRLEAIQIKLTGEMEKHYDVYYRVHAQRLGWMGWAKNGAQAGTAGFSYRLESIQVVLVPKGAKAPAATYKGIERQYANPFLQK